MSCCCCSCCSCTLPQCNGCWATIQSHSGTSYRYNRRRKIIRALPIVEQGPSSYCGPVPCSAGPGIVPVGTKVYSCSGGGPGSAPVYGIDPETGKPIYAPPISAAPTCGPVGVASRQCGANPGPVPPVGTISPQACSPVLSPSGCGDAVVAPPPAKIKWGGLALFAGIIVLLWIFAGLSFRRFV